MEFRIDTTPWKAVASELRDPGRHFRKAVGLALLDIAVRLVTAIRKAAPRFRGFLVKSVGHELLELPSFSRLRVHTAAPYAAPLEWGRLPGSMPPVEPLAPWFRRKLGLSPKAALSAAWGYAITLKRRGRRATPFFWPTIIERRRDIEASFRRNMAGMAATWVRRLAERARARGRG